MSGQWLAVIVLIALAALYVLRILRLSLRKGGCGTGACGKCAAPPADEKSRPGTIPLEQVRRD